MMIDSPRTAPLLAATLGVALLAGAVGAQAQLTKDQQKCIGALNKNLQKVAATAAKDFSGCIKDHNKGKNGVTSLPVCFAADRDGKVAKATGKTVDADTKRCTGTDKNTVDKRPAVGATDAATVNGAGEGSALAVIDALYGPDADAAAIDAATDAAAAKCQESVAKALVKCQATKLKEFNKCKKSALGEGADTAEELEACVLADAKGKIAKTCNFNVAGKTDKIRGALGKCGDSGVDLASTFAQCDGATRDEVHECVDVPLECTVCEAINTADALDADCDYLDNAFKDGSCGGLSAVSQETVDIVSAAEPAETPGTSGVVVTNPKLITQFGGAGFSLNNARYTRYFLDPEPVDPPDAILVLIPGFEGGAGTFKVLAENLIRRAEHDHALTLQVWAVDRRSNQLEDLVGLDVAEATADPDIALDWLFGAELGLTLHPDLVAGPNRRAEFYNNSDDVPFIAGWTRLVFSQDIDAVIDAARAAAAGNNVFLGGHSAGTGFTARYAATDFDLAGAGPADPGYTKVRGLVLLEGGGGSTAGTPPTEDDLDRVEDRFDGGLFAAVRDGAPRCIDGTPCTVVTEVADCAGKGNGTCTEPESAYATGLLNPRLLAAGEVTAIQAINDPDTGLNVVRVDQNATPGNNAIDQVADLASLSFLPDATAYAGLGLFLDDDQTVAALAPFVATSLGSDGAPLGGITTWRDITEPQLASAFTDNGPAPTSLPAAVWGREREVTRMDRMVETFYVGGTNFTDWYYPSSGLAVTSGLISLDSTALSADSPGGRGRRDIENLTEAANIDVPVICLGGTNGLTPVPGVFTAFGQSIGACTAASCDGTARVVDALVPNDAFPTFGDVAGGFEVHMTEGIAHVDITTAEDGPDNNVVTPLAAFIARNVQ